MSYPTRKPQGRSAGRSKPSIVQGTQAESRWPAVSIPANSFSSAVPVVSEINVGRRANRGPHCLCSHLHLRHQPCPNYPYYSDTAVDRGYPPDSFFFRGLCLATYNNPPENGRLTPFLLTKVVVPHQSFRCSLLSRPLLPWVAAAARTGRFRT